MRLTKRQESIITGSVLGDCFLQKTGSQNARIRFEHGEKQKDYLIWKGAQFPRLFQGKPSHLQRVHPKTKKCYEYWRWQSNATPEIGKLRNIFYPGGEKIIPVNISDLLTDPVGLAVWYMDDGYYDLRSKSSYIYLGKVSANEASLLQNALFKNFGLNSKIYDKKNKGHALFFGVQETKKFHEIIRASIIPSMQYKLSKNHTSLTP